ncbi:hypothetical protein GCM10029992_49840 [Glycomyces albus]
MKVAVYSTKPYDEEFLRTANGDGRHELVFLEPKLNRDTAALAAGTPAVCAFVNDDLGAEVLAALAEQGCDSSRCARPGSTTWTCVPRRGSV